jgi:hypothetical protein
MARLGNLWTIVAESLTRGGVQSVFYAPGKGGRALGVRVAAPVAVRDIALACRLALARSRAGQRTMVSIGSSAGEVTAPALVDAMNDGTGAGLVIATATAEQAAVIGTLWLQPFDRHSARALAQTAPVLSELFGLPVVLSTELLGHNYAGARAFPSPHRILEIAECFAGKQFRRAEAGKTADVRLHVAKKQAAVRRFARELERQIAMCTAP